ncbi:conjugal transfer protein TraD [Sphingomonas sp. BAUL-RG-20F-R05-02]|uniref:conjugal transfer protein TraD n=1 Tax=Sphingomonas sp. BAUL-RG-20F-R05-02 TaxID=2914830 RepID=UPI001F56ED1C|nr:conjugal transfer protein TraD [Sphingomonas sp. BAUL-RG-20F-R05-02]
MAKIRDYNAELKALEERARTLKARRIEQLGSLVASTGGDTLDLEILAGVLLEAVASKDNEAKEAWRAKGAAFFQRRRRKGAETARGDSSDGTTDRHSNPSSVGTSSE